MVHMQLCRNGEEIQGRIVKVTNLPKCPNPYVKVVIRDKGVQVKKTVKHTRTLQQTSHPEYNFNFKMEASHSSCLEIKVNHYQPYSLRASKTTIGQTRASLEALPASLSDPKADFWYYIYPPEKEKKMEIQVGTPQRQFSRMSDADRPGRSVDAAPLYGDAIIRGFLQVRHHTLVGTSWVTMFVVLTDNAFKLYDLNEESKEEATLKYVIPLANVVDVSAEGDAKKLVIEYTENGSNVRKHFKTSSQDDWMQWITDTIAELRAMGGASAGHAGTDIYEMAAIGSVVDLPPHISRKTQIKNSKPRFWFILYKTENKDDPHTPHEHLLAHHNMELDELKNIDVPCFSKSGSFVIHLENGTVKEITSDKIQSDTSASVKLELSQEMVLEWKITKFKADKATYLELAQWSAFVLVGLLLLGPPAGVFDVRVLFFLVGLLGVAQSILTVVSVASLAIRHAQPKLTISVKLDRHKKQGDSAVDDGVLLVAQAMGASAEFGTDKHSEVWGMWENSTTEGLKVRGPNYLKDRVKVSAEEHMFSNIHLDFFTIADKREQMSSNNEWIKAYRQNNPAVVCSGAGAVTEAEIVQNMIFIASWQIPADPWWTLANYFVFDKQRLDSDLIEVFCRTLHRFVNEAPEVQAQKFKLIPRVVEGSYLVKHGVGTTPAILGKKLKTNFYYDKTLNVFEVEVDVSSSSIAGQILGLVKGAARSLVIDLNILVESQADDELPEVILGGCRISNADLAKLPPFPA